MRLHEQLIRQACKADGWQTGPWKKLFTEKCKENPYWDGEMNETATGDDDETMESEMRQILRERWPNPDAWRLVVEGQREGWGYDVLVLEFLEVEVTNGINQNKKDGYRRFWMLFDSSSFFHFRVFHMDKHGVIRPFMTEATI